MKIIHQVQVETGDTLASIAAGLTKYTGVQHTTADVWDFNRQSMPAPGMLPAVGTILRFPHDPHGGNVDGSGGPSLDSLKGAVSDDDIKRSTTTIGDAPKAIQEPDPKTVAPPAGEPGAGAQPAADTGAAEGSTAGAGAPGAAEDGFEV